MSRACVFVTLAVVVMAQAEPFPQFYNPFGSFGSFMPQPFFHHVPLPQPYVPVPNYGQMFSQIGTAQGNIPLNGGSVQFSSTNLGLGGGNYHEKMVTTVIGPDGKPVQKIYENVNGVETEKEIVGKPQSTLFGNGFSNSMIMSSGFGGGNYESTIFTAETGPDGKTVAKVYKNKDGKEDVKEIEI